MRTDTDRQTCIHTITGKLISIKDKWTTLRKRTEMEISQATNPHIIPLIGNSDRIHTDSVIKQYMYLIDELYDIVFYSNTVLYLIDALYLTIPDSITKLYMKNVPYLTLSDSITALYLTLSDSIKVHLPVSDRCTVSDCIC